MQIGVVPVLSPHSGGIYQYSGSILSALYHGESEHEYLVFAEDAAPLGFMNDSRPGWRVLSLQKNSLKSLARKYVHRLVGTEYLQDLWEPVPYPKVDPEEVFDPDVVNYLPERGRYFTRSGADFVFYPSPTPLSFEAGIPFVMAIHDLKFELFAEFPEMLKKGALEAYEYCIRNAIRYAGLILAGSQAAKNEILRYGEKYGLAEDRISVLPPAPAAYLDPDISEDEVNEVLAIYRLAEPYLFYPSAFWPHKNHKTLIQALDLVRHEFKISAPLVLCGSRSGSVRQHVYGEIMELIKDLGLHDQVKYLGLVPDEHMSALYSRARMVVAPVLHGTSISLVQDCWSFGRPFIGPKTGVFQDQVEDGGMLVDPRAAEELAEAIRKLWTEPETCSRFVSNGRRRSLSPLEYSARLQSVWREARTKMASSLEF